MRHTTEEAGYPALLLTSLLALVIAVSGFMVVVVTGAAWTVGLAIACVLLALAIVMVVILADVSEGGPGEE
jgi:hypothetical protein